MCLPTSLSVYLPTYLHTSTIYLSIYLSIYLYTCLCILMNNLVYSHKQHSNENSILTRIVHRVYSNALQNMLIHKNAVCYTEIFGKSRHEDRSKTRINTGILAAAQKQPRPDVEV